MRTAEMMERKRRAGCEFVPMGERLARRLALLKTFRQPTVAEIEEKQWIESYLAETRPLNRGGAEARRTEDIEVPQQQRPTSDTNEHE